MLTTVSPTAILKRITLSLTLFICTTLSIHFSAIKIPTPDVPCLQPFQKNLYLLSPPSNVLAFSPFHFVSCTQQKSSSLLPTISTTSPLWSGIGNLSLTIILTLITVCRCGAMVTRSHKAHQIRSSIGGGGTGYL